MTSHNVILGKFNEKINFAFSWHSEFISIEDGRIDEERKKIYEQLSRYLEQTTGKKLERIPFIGIDELAIYTDQQSRSLLQLVDGENIIEYPDFTHFTNKNFLKIHPQLNDSPHGSSTGAGSVFSLMVYPFKNDNQANYDIAAFANKPSLAEIFPKFEDLNPNPDDDDKKERENNNAVIQRWVDVKTEEGIRDIMIELTNLKDGVRETDFELWLQNWPIYVKYILFESEASRLKPLRNEKGNGFVMMMERDPRTKEQDPIEFLIVDQTDTEWDWRKLLLKYRKENPSTEYDALQPILNTRPYDYYILNRSYISFIAYHRKEKKMIGYAVFGLRNTPYLASHKNELRGTDLKLFDEAMKEREKRKDLGYDVFHLEGFHVHRDYRDPKKPLSNGVSIAKMFVFTGLEFIRHTSVRLGVKMIASSALASATKQILVGTFGFSHYNRQNDTKWLRAIFEDFFISIQKKEGKTHRERANQKNKVETPTKLLTLGHLLRESVRLNATYKYSEKETGLLTSAIDRLRKMVSQYGEEKDPTPPEKGLSRKFRSDLDSILKKFRELQDSVRKDWDNKNKAQQSKESKYMIQLRVYLNTGVDDDDTLLFIGGERLPQQLLDAMEKFPLKPPIIQDDDADGDIGNPTEEEMVLYDMVLDLLSDTNLTPPLIENDNNKEEPVETNEISIEQDDDRKEIEKLRKQKVEEEESVKELRQQEREIYEMIISLEEQRSEILREIDQHEDLIRQIEKDIEKREDAFVRVEEMVIIPEQNEVEPKPIESNDKEEEEKMILEKKQTRKDVFDNKEEITGKNYKRIKEAYIAAVGAVSVIMWNNYKAKFKLHDSGPGREGDKMYKVLKELGYPNEGFPQTFVQWKKAGSIPRISRVSLEIIVPLLKERHPLLLDYMDAELYPSK